MSTPVLLQIWNTAAASCCQLSEPLNSLSELTPASGACRRLEVKGTHVAVDLQALTCCPDVQLTASKCLCLHPLDDDRLGRADTGYQLELACHDGLWLG